MDAKLLDYASRPGLPRRGVRRIIAVTLAAAIMLGWVLHGPKRMPAARPWQLIDRVHADLDHIETAILCFEADTGAVPSEGDGLARLCRPTWRGPCLKALPRDPWGRAYVYHENQSPNSVRGFSILCLGLDGIEGTADDIRPMMRSCGVGMMAVVELRQLHRKLMWKTQLDILETRCRRYLPWQRDTQKLSDFRLRDLRSRLSDLQQRIAKDDSFVVASPGDTSTD